MGTLTRSRASGSTPGSPPRGNLIGSIRLTALLGSMRKSRSQDCSLGSGPTCHDMASFQIGSRTVTAEPIPTWHNAAFPLRGVIWLSLQMFLFTNIQPLRGHYCMTFRQTFLFFRTMQRPNAQLCPRNFSRSFQGPLNLWICKFILI